MEEKKVSRKVISCSFVLLLFSLLSFITSIYDTISKVNTYGWVYSVTTIINDKIIKDTVYLKQYFAFSLGLGIMLLCSLYVYGSMYFYCKERGYLDE